MLGSSEEEALRTGSGFRLPGLRHLRLKEGERQRGEDAIVFRLLADDIRALARWSFIAAGWRSLERSNRWCRRWPSEDNCRQRLRPGILDTAMLRVVDVLVLRQCLVQLRNNRQHRNPGGTLKGKDSLRELSDPRHHHTNWRSMFTLPIWHGGDAV
ncbi:MAG: hypothetical protein JXQ75_00995 [Phycisphaerae bacterium]|nr:hypothetical protein [Phycisphaerae bacterium]